MKDTPIRVESLAYGLGQDVIEKSRQQLAEVVSWERLRREKSNHCEIETLRARYTCCLERRQELKEILRLAPCENVAALKCRRRNYWLLALVLIMAGIFFAHLTLAPFGLGWEAWLFSLGLGLVAAFWAEKTFEEVHSETVIRWVCIVCLLSSLGGLVIMALLRGDILALYLQSAVAGEIAMQSQGSAASNFYSQAIPKLQLLMALLTVAMELGSGMAIFQARRIDLASLEHSEKARKELREAEDEIVSIIERVTHLKNDPGINEAQVYRDFYLGILERVRKTALMQPMLIFVVFLSLTVGTSLNAETLSEPGDKTAAEPTNIVIAIDFTQSVAGKDYNGKTEYERNTDGACRLISTLPPGSHVTVLAITDRSFSQPYVLLQRDLPSDKGPLQFLDRIAIAKAEVTATMCRALQSASPKYSHTDILGALFIASDIFKQSQGKKILIVFSDMRQSTQQLDLEDQSTIPVATALRKVEGEKLVPDLKGVELYVLGVDALGKSVRYWNALRDFWIAYFSQAGANLNAYSVLREAPEFLWIR